MLFWGPFFYSTLTRALDLFLDTLYLPQTVDSLDRPPSALTFQTSLKLNSWISPFPNLIKTVIFTLVAILETLYPLISWCPKLLAAPLLQFSLFYSESKQNFKINVRTEK